MGVDTMAKLYHDAIGNEESEVESVIGVHSNGYANLMAQWYLGRRFATNAVEHGYAALVAKFQHVVFTPYDNFIRFDSTDRLADAE